MIKGINYGIFQKTSKSLYNCDGNLFPDMDIWFYGIYGFFNDEIIGI
jgi:hypothetical protein